MSAEPESTYSLGYEPDMVRMLQTRSASVHARHLLAHLKPGMRVLDAGCGPGSITLGLVQAVGPEGAVTGIDFEPSQVEAAWAAARKAAVANVQFQCADLTRLPFADATFDAAHMHAVLCHVPDRRAALAELFRVLKPGGVIATADPVFSRTIGIPEEPAAMDSLRLLGQAMDCFGGDGDFGLRSAAALHEAGFVRLEITTALETTATHKAPAHLMAMAEGMPDRPAIQNLLQRGLLTPDHLREMQETLAAASQKPFYSLSVPSVSVVGWKP